MYTLELTQIENSVGVVFPRELLDQLQLEAGDLLYLTQIPDGVRLTQHNPEFARQIGAACRIMKKRRAVLHELGK